ncbi:MAG: hypothetical protein ABI970_17030, partial [Chloroflexota bacterium]
MNHSDTDDTEIISGDEGDPTPIHDIAVDAANANAEFEPVVEPVIEYQPPPEIGLVAQPEMVINDSEMLEQQPQLETNYDWQSQSPNEESLVPVDTVPEAFTPEKVKPQLTGWQQIRSFFFGGSSAEAIRLNNLTQSIEDAPESPVNYVLRAELYMGLREYALAQADFQRAIEVAEIQFELADWGLLDQVTRDRALA